VNGYGVTVARAQGHSRVPNPWTGHQRTWEPSGFRAPFPSHPERAMRIGPMPTEEPGRGGAAVVLRAGESPAHGEGRQRASQGEECNVRRTAGEHRRHEMAGP